jgi:two-component system response regulator HydG
MLEILDPHVCKVCGLHEDQKHGNRQVRVVARSAPMQAVMRRAARIAPSEAPVLLHGESGTGKEVVARALHAASGRDGRFVAVNCAALPAELLESELFGHARGAFSGAVAARRGLFEEASGGTLFLDEIAEIPLPLQAKLLRALQDGEIRRVGENEVHPVDVRVVAATNRRLEDAVSAGTFRADLYYRLKVFGLSIPPLRERPADILPLADALLQQLRPGASFSPAAEQALLAHSWPGNVRELMNAVRHAAVLGEGAAIEPEDLPADVVALETVHGFAPDAPVQRIRHHLAGFAPGAPLDEVVRAHVSASLQAAASRTEAARSLGIGRNTLWRWTRAT